LPFSRLTFDADWKNSATPDKVTPFKDIFMNRRNNGVVAEVTMDSGIPTGATWSDFNLNYGLGTLMSQTVGLDEMTKLGTVRDHSAVQAGSQQLAEGQRIDFTVPLPSERGLTSRTCDIGKTVPASTLFKSLDGDAINVHCGSVSKSGEKVGFDGLFLINYGIFWASSMDDRDGRTEAVIRNVTIQ
jgi:hypothetical protein